MKSSQRHVTIGAVLSLVLAGTLHAQSNRAPDSHLGAIARVTKDSVKNRFTAKDMIGAAVYDRTGEKIGDIADIDLQGAVASPLASAYNLDHLSDRSDTRPMPAAGTADAPRASSTAGADSAIAHATVFVSVGGLWGVGDDLVSVPMSKFTYNTSEGRFELAAAKAEVVALAESGAKAGHAASAPISSTSAGKQSFADEASRVQSALKADPLTSAFASTVIVTTDGKTLKLQGIVDNKEQEQRLLETARRSTSLKVEDAIDVRD